MAISQKKVTRKELLKEPDQFITFSGRLIAFGQRYRRSITYTTIAVLGLLAAFTAVRYFTARAEMRAFTLLDQDTAAYHAAASTTGPVKAWEAVHDRFDSLIADYGSRTGGRLARIRYGDICFAAGRSQEAVKLYAQALKDFDGEPFYQALLLNCLGQAHWQNRSLDQAADYLRQVADTPGAPLQDKALFGLADVYEAQGKREQSRDALQRLLDQFPGSNYAQVARERIHDS